MPSVYSTRKIAPSRSERGDQFQEHRPSAHHREAGPVRLLHPSMLPRLVVADVTGSASPAHPRPLLAHVGVLDSELVSALAVSLRRHRMRTKPNLVKQVIRMRAPSEIGCSNVHLVAIKMSNNSVRFGLHEKRACYYGMNRYHPLFARILQGHNLVSVTCNRWAHYHSRFAIHVPEFINSILGIARNQV